MALSNTIPRQYDPKSVILLLGDVVPTDVAPDTMFTLNKEEDRIIPQVGVLGEVALARNRNELGMLTLSLKQTSPMNSTLMFWYIAEEAGAQFFPVYFEDPASGIKLVTTGWVQTQPDFALGKEVAQLDWVIGLANVQWELIPGSTLLVDRIRQSLGLS
jgi:hypothetical protein